MSPSVLLLIRTASNRAALSLLIVIALFCQANAFSSSEDVCVEEQACSCKLQDHQYLDISQVTPSGGTLVAKNQNISYVFSPCENLVMNISKILNVTVNSSTDNCIKATSLCLFNATDNSTLDLGKIQDRKFHGGPSSIQLVYNDKLHATIYLECIDSSASFFAWLGLLQKPVETTVLALMSSHACLKYEHEGLSLGSKLLILVSVSFAVYLIGGVLVLHFLRGARGKEVIPNVEFWCALPSLVRDGFIFLLNGCNPVTTTNTAEAYDRI